MNKLLEFFRYENRRYDFVSRAYSFTRLIVRSATFDCHRSSLNVAFDSTFDSRFYFVLGFVSQKALENSIQQQHRNQTCHLHLLTTKDSKHNEKITNKQSTELPYLSHIFDTFLHNSNNINDIVRSSMSSKQSHTHM